MAGTSGIDAIWIAAISAGGAVLAASIAAVATYWLTRRREHDTDWRKLRLEKYQEFLLALSGIVDGRSTDATQARFADAVNTITLVAPMSVYRRIRDFHEHNSVSNPNRDRGRHDSLLTELIWAMRADVHPALSDRDDTIFYLMRPPGAPSEEPEAARKMEAPPPDRGGKPMIDVYRIVLSKDRLKSLPPDERSLLLLLGYVANQIAMTQKIVTFMTNRAPADPVEEKLAAVQTQMMARNMIGVLNEGWLLIKKRFVSKPLGRAYEPLLDAGGVEALAKLKRHFGASNLLSKIRNDYAYHLPEDAEVDAAFQAAIVDPEWDDDWYWYMSGSNFNSLYFPSDIVVLHGILKSINGTNLRDAQAKIMGEVRLVSDLMGEFIPALTAAIWRKHFGNDMMADKVFNIGTAPSIWDVTIPFFVEVSAPPEDPEP